ncbi:MAG: FAD-binding oxidoreductase [Gammaproteobacteria bacterium]|nr:FAD-binding oxidoreductase [Gammaproteobacteria bacterium]
MQPDQITTMLNMESFDHIIVGGGVIGASIAYHLTCKSAGTVLILERNDLASAASSRAAGLVLQASTKYSKTPLAKQTVDIIPVLADELDESSCYHQVGSLRIAASVGRVEELDAMACDAEKCGIQVQWPGVAEVANMLPWLNTSIVHKSALLPGDGYIDPYLLTMMYANAARKRGAVIRPHTAVRDVLISREKVVGVMTDTARIGSGVVIDACGAWAAVFAARAGYPLPMAPVRSHYWIAEPAKAYCAEQPIAILPDAAAYTRPEIGGLILGVQEPHSITFDARKLPADPDSFSPTHGEEHWDVLIAAYQSLAQFYPSIDNAKISNYVCGLSSYTPDGEIILGPVPGLSGFYAAAGACGSGITLSAGMGDLLSDMVLGHQPAVDVSPFRPDRFGRVDPFSQEFRTRCAAARAVKSRKRI